MATRIDPTALQSLRAELEAMLHEHRTHVEGLQASADDLTGDNASDVVLERDLARGAAAVDRGEIGQIEGALERIAQGTYGVCEGCGEPIPLERLRAIPQTRHCVRCPPPR